MMQEKRSDDLVYKLLRLAHSGAAIGFVTWSWGRAAAKAPQGLLWPLDEAVARVPGKLGVDPGAATVGGSAISGPAWAWVCMAASTRVARLLEPLVPSPPLY